MRNHSPYWDLITPDEMKAMCLNMDLKKWMRLSAIDKSKIEWERSEILRRMNSSFLPTIDSSSICISPEQFLNFKSTLCEAKIREARLEVEAQVHRLDKAPFVLSCIAGIGAMALMGWLSIKDDSAWGIYSSPVVGLLIAWQIFRMRQQTIRRQHGIALAAFERLKAGANSI